MLKALGNWLLGGGVEQAADYFRERAKLKQELKLIELKGRQQVLQAKYEAEARRQDYIHSWEMLQITNSGVKDEIVLAVLLIPYVGSFIPGVQDYIQTGFQYLSEMPAWAVGLTVAIFLAIYGIRHRNASSIQAPGLREKDVNNVNKTDSNK